MTIETKTRFVAHPPQGNFVQRWLWHASDDGHAKLALRRACAGEGEKWSEVHTAIDRLADVERSASQAVLYSALLAHAGWQSMQREEWADAWSYCTTLAESEPNSDLATLAWDLAWCHARRDDHTQFVQFAQLFQSLAAGLQAAEVDHAALLSQAYLMGVAEELLDPLADNLRQFACTRALQAMVDVPHHFADRAVVQTVKVKLVGIQTEFCPELERDKLLILARCAAWELDLQQVTGLVQRANTIGIAGDELTLWTTFCGLANSVSQQSADASAQGSAATQIDWAAECGPSLRGQHLAALTNVYRSSDLDVCEQYLDAYLISLNHLAKLEWPDRWLAMRVLQCVLTLDWQNTDADLQQGSALTQKLLKALGNPPPRRVWDEGGEDIVELSRAMLLPWCSYTQAVDALCRSADSALTIERLDQAGKAEMLSAAVLRQAANFLSGGSESQTTLLSPYPTDGVPQEFIDRIPGLQAAAELIEQANVWRTTGDDAKIPRVLNAQAPGWVHWLHARVCCVALPGAELLNAWPDWQIESTEKFAQVAWFLEERCPMGLDHSALQAAADQAGAGERSTSKSSTALPPRLLQNHVKLDELNVVDYVAARVAFRENAIQQADALFAKIVRRTAEGNDLDELRWGALTKYWRAMVHLARQEDDAATELLQSLAATWMDARAQSQLSLLALRGGDLNQAQRLLADVPPGVNDCVQYAQAVLAARSGDLSRAQQLTTDLVRFGDVSGPRYSGVPASLYPLRARRLLVALTEPGDDHAGAAELESLATAGDNRARLRLIRLCLQQWAEKSLEAQASAQELASQALAISAQLAELETNNSVDDKFQSELNRLAAILPGAVLTPDESNDDALRLFRALLCVACGDFAGVMAELTTMQHRQPATELVAQVSAFLSGYENGGEMNSAAAKPVQTRALSFLKEIEQHPDIAPHWGLWLRSVADSSAMSGDLSAAAGIAMVKSAMPDPTASQVALMNFVQAVAGHASDDTLTNYELLRDSLDSLPISGIEIWLHCAAIWLAQNNWQELLERDLPDCVADLEDPRVRLCIGLAYACAGAQAADKGGNREAANLLARARSTLEILQVADEGESG